MRAILFLLLVLAVVAFVSLYESALRPYWTARMPRVTSHLSDGEFREAASAMVDEVDDAPPAAMDVATSPKEPALPDTSREGDGDGKQHTE